MKSPLRLLAALCLLASLTSSLATPDSLRGLGGYDVIVVGSEPEAIAAAVAAAEEGARTMLISEDERLGGLFVLGGLNVLDLRTQPVNLQRGLFERWWSLVGRGHSFDVLRAEEAFGRLLERSGVELRLGVPDVSPVVEAGRVVGVLSGGVAVAAAQVIDGTADMDFAARAGAGYSVGFESLGLEERMVDTLVIRIDGIDWQELTRAVRERGRGYASIDERVAWGHFDGYPARFRATEEGIRLRGLNLGLQDDGSVLVNALLIHGIDPFDAESREAGRARAMREAPRVVAYLADGIPGFSEARYAGAAPRLYVRESRHLEAQCILSVDDVLDNRVTANDVAAGGYPLDVQILTPHDSGYVFGTPEVYGVRLCVTVPIDVDGLWVVGKSAGYDPIAASSARVVPFGMNVAEAVGVAAAAAVRLGLEPREFAGDEGRTNELRQRLLGRGAYLPPLVDRQPAGPHEHPHYRAFRLMLSRGLAVGGYANDPGLESETSRLSYLYLLSNVLTRFFDRPDLARELVDTVGTPPGELTLAWALDLTRTVACRLGHCRPSAHFADAARVVAVPDRGLTRGEGYALAASLVDWVGSHHPQPAAEGEQ